MSHTEAYCEHEEGVKTHTRGKGERLLCIEGHHQRTYYGCQGCCGKYRTCGHAGQGTEDAGVDGQDVGHRQEGGQTRKNLGAHIVLLRIKPESFF